MVVAVLLVVLISFKMKDLMLNLISFHQKQTCKNALIQMPNLHKNQIRKQVLEMTKMIYK